MTNMNGVQTGNTVKVHYRGMLEDGTEFDSSTGKAPVQLEVGNGSLVPALEAALIGMTPGDTKTVTVIADEAYGQHQPELVQTLARDEIPAEVGLAVGIRDPEFVKRFSVDRIGVALRRSKDVEGFRIYVSSVFE